jgi:hypothetical protein
VVAEQDPEGDLCEQLEEDRQQVDSRQVHRSVRLRSEQRR